MLNNGDKAPDVRVHDSNGVATALSDLWRERPLILVFLRHFG